MDKRKTGKQIFIETQEDYENLTIEEEEVAVEEEIVDGIGAINLVDAEQVDEKDEVEVGPKGARYDS